MTATVMQNRWLGSKNQGVLTFFPLVLEGAKHLACLI
jgi:hypothetical protein